MLIFALWQLTCSDETSKLRKDLPPNTSDSETKTEAKTEAEAETKTKSKAKTEAKTEVKTAFFVLETKTTFV